MERTRTPLDHRRASIICAIAVAHFLFWVGLLALRTADTMARFDGSRESGFESLLLKRAYETLSFPLVTAFQLSKVAPLGIWEWLVIVCNSLAWGWVAWRAVRVWRMRHAESN